MILTVDLAIYPLEVVLRACHPFTARCYVLPREIENGRVTIELTPRDANDLLHGLEGELDNALLDTRLRVLIADETRAIRELLVTQAFCEADLLDRTAIDGDEQEDMRGIAR